ncbi:MLO-LIKE PROTEIN [Salix koriyanagi]|uniref:MLO-LIKE PROTEIN n=1 Tax=Salix koriyanagi TaxID=2511006 RepID=A0A9Q0UED7_9ROSI|nr:MLO-LIKE PROTEIN [Salix koriyanagi]
MAGEGEAKTLEETPTWAVATVCFFLISISIFIEHLFHLLAKYFNKKRRKYLIQALYKIKSELMLLGFISLLLTVTGMKRSQMCRTGKGFFVVEGRYEATPVLDFCAGFLSLCIEHFYIRPRDGQDEKMGILGGGDKDTRLSIFNRYDRLMVTILFGHKILGWTH